MEAGQSTQQTPFVPPMGPQEDLRRPRELTQGEDERAATLQQWQDYRKALSFRLEALEAELIALRSIRNGLTAAIDTAETEKADPSESPY